MTCHRINVTPEARGWACTRGARRSTRCRWCKAAATLLCDFPLTGRKAGQTCDAPICERCAKRMGKQVIEGVRDTVDYCPVHARKASQLSLPDTDGKRAKVRP